MSTAIPTELPVRTATAAELDGRHLEPSTLHCRIADDDSAVLSYPRVLCGPEGGSRIGRVVTERSARFRCSVCGRAFVEDGIPHVPMALAPVPPVPPVPPASAAAAAAAPA